MRTQTEQVTWTKLRSGEWGVRGPEDLVRDGATVTVAKRDGSTSQVTVRRVLWRGDGIALAAVASQGGRSHECTDDCYATHPCRQCGGSDAYCIGGEWGCFRYDDEV